MLLRNRFHVQQHADSRRSLREDGDISSEPRLSLHDIYDMSSKFGRPVPLTGLLLLAPIACLSYIWSPLLSHFRVPPLALSLLRLLTTPYWSLPLPYATSRFPSSCCSPDPPRCPPYCIKCIKQDWSCCRFFTTCFPTWTNDFRKKHTARPANSRTSKHVHLKLTKTNS